MWVLTIHGQWQPNSWECDNIYVSDRAYLCEYAQLHIMHVASASASDLWGKLPNIGELIKQGHGLDSGSLTAKCVTTSRHASCRWMLCTITHYACCKLKVIHIFESLQNRDMGKWHSWVAQEMCWYAQLHIHILTPRIRDSYYCVTEKTG